MDFINWLNKKNSNMDVFDTGLTKWTVFFFTILLVKFWPVLTTLDWYVYLIAAIILAIRPVYHFFGNKRK